MTNKILVVSLEKGFEKFEKEIKKTVFKALRILKKKNVSVEIYLVGSPKMRFLNKKFRGKDKTADILSFEEPKNGFIYPSSSATGGGESKFKRIGEIYLNLDISQINVDETQINPPHINICGINANKKISENLRKNLRGSVLLVHGLLHLFGYHHNKKNDKIRMDKAEQKLLLQITDSKHQAPNNK
ncbi:MAG TPA: hypothetical protein ENH26_01885 [Candidatus Wolfebacteria bacterium]|nr:hypothetical protein [Candidatus Wolfebacteria bacterium]